MAMGHRIKRIGGLKCCLGGRVLHLHQNAGDDCHENECPECGQEGAIHSQDGGRQNHKKGYDHQ